MVAALEKYVPVLSRRGANYPAGGESWAGTAQRVALSAAEQAAGMVPNTPVDPQSFNHLVGVLGEHLETIIDAPSFNWSPQPKYAHADLSSDTTGNRNEVDDPPLLYAAGERWLVKTIGGGTGVCFHSRLYGQGGQLTSDSDSTAFTASTDSGAGATALLMANRLSNRVLAVDGSGVVRYTDDYGATWSGGGTFVGSSKPRTGGLYRGTRWVGVYTSSSATHTLGYSETLSGAWTAPGAVVTTDDCAMMRTITNGNTCVFLPDSCATSSEFLVDTGAGFSAVAVTGAGSGWRGCYHDLLDKYFATNLAGQLWSSSDALTWALEGTLASGVYDVVPHGRGLIVSTETEDFTGPATDARLTYVTWDRDQTLVERRMPWSSTGLIYPRYHLIHHRGRAIAARLNVSVSISERLEYWLSHVHPAHLVAASGL